MKLSFYMVTFLLLAMNYSCGMERVPKLTCSLSEWVKEVKAASQEDQKLVRQQVTNFCQVFQALSLTIKDNDITEIVKARDRVLDLMMVNRAYYNKNPNVWQLLNSSCLEPEDSGWAEAYTQATRQIIQEKELTNETLHDLSEEQKRKLLKQVTLRCIPQLEKDTALRLAKCKKVVAVLL